MIMTLVKDADSDRGYFLRNIFSAWNYGETSASIAHKFS